MQGCLISKFLSLTHNKKGLTCGYTPFKPNLVQVNDYKQDKQRVCTTNTIGVLYCAELFAPCYLAKEGESEEPQPKSYCFPDG
jgi:hypothetical protein